MFDLRKTTAIIFAKLVSFILKKTKSGGTAAPGLIALKIDPKLLFKLKRQLKFSIIISGTNGKTTTTRMLASILKSANIKYFHNRTGSNLLRGIVSELISHSTITGSISSNIGLWEIDEAVFPYAIEELKPKIVVLTNLFRDQLDRYGEIDTLAKKWQKALNKLGPETTVILNADDPTVASLGKKLKCKVLYFGIKDKSLGSTSLSHASDATLCPACFSPLNYQTCFVSHLGIYQCKKCGKIQPKTNISCKKAKFQKNKIQVKTNQLSFIINSPGLYNIYNGLAAYIVAQTLKIDAKKICQGFKNFQPAFGRFEEISLGEKSLRILLVKNPAGFNEVLKTLSHLAGTKKISLLLVLNDLIADGRDVSWIWDVDFKLLRKVNIEKLIISGTRTYDMALRVKHAKFKVQSSKFKVQKDLKKAISDLLNSKNKNLFILPTYTAMLETRKILNKMGLVHSTWED